MPKHGFRFPREVIDAVREHVSQAIHRIEPERFSQEANYTAALASQLEGTAYEGKHGMVVFKSTVFDDRREQRGSELLTITLRMRRSRYRSGIKASKTAAISPIPI